MPHSHQQRHTHGHPQWYRWDMLPNKSYYLATRRTHRHKRYSLLGLIHHRWYKMDDRLMYMNDAPGCMCSFHYRHNFLHYQILHYQYTQYIHCQSVGRNNHHKVDPYSYYSSMNCDNLPNIHHHNLYILQLRQIDCNYIL